MVLINSISTMKETFEVPELRRSAIEVDENFYTGFCWSETRLSPLILKHILRQERDSDLTVSPSNLLRSELFCHGNFCGCLCFR